MKYRAFFSTILLAFATLLCQAQSLPDTAAEHASLNKATQVLRDAFARGDIPTIVSLHHPNIVKYFGGNNVVVGRADLEKGLKEMFQNGIMEFIGNQVESTLFLGETAIETSIFTIRFTPNNGGQPNVSRGRAMVIYVRSKESPTGWLSIREMAQEAPALSPKS